MSHVRRITNLGVFMKLRKKYIYLSFSSTGSDPSKAPSTFDSCAPFRTFLESRRALRANTLRNIRKRAFFFLLFAEYSTVNMPFLGRHLCKCQIECSKTYDFSRKKTFQRHTMSKQIKTISRKFHSISRPNVTRERAGSQKWRAQTWLSRTYIRRESTFECMPLDSTDQKQRSNNFLRKKSLKYRYLTYLTNRE